MFNSNGKLVSSLNEISSDFITQLHTQLTVSEILRIENGNILFWEYHYFRIIAGLRRHRFEIPMNFTMEYLETEISKLFSHDQTNQDSILLRIQFLANENSIDFLISSNKVLSLDKIEPTKNYNLDLFKEASIQAVRLSNLSTTNATMFTIGKWYAEENGLDDCILLNDQKNLKETLQGSLYLLQKDTILTPSLECGCQDFALRSAFNDWIEKEQKTIELFKQAINPFELQKSEELMVLSIERGGQSVSQYRKTNYRSFKLQQLFAKFVRELY